MRTKGESVDPLENPVAVVSLFASTVKRSRSMRECSMHSTQTFVEN